MDQNVDQRDFKLLEQDRYTFAVLYRILNGPCRLTLTDHQRLIICHSAPPYPVWIWTPDDLSPEEQEQAWRTVNQVCPMAEGYTYNLKYDLAAFFLAKAQEQGIHGEIQTNMYAYDCPNPIPPGISVDGHLHQCTQDDLEEAAELIGLFHEDIAIDQSDHAHYFKKAQELIGCKRFYVWKDRCKRTVSCCYYVPNGDLASVSGVYTIPAYRRKHYAENLVYAVTKMIQGTGAMPMLYTDADYAASNACYEKIGYVLRGKLCKIGASNHGY